MKKTFFMFLVFVISSCQVSSPKTAILEISSCDLPCWNGITLGSTTKEELTNLLSIMPLVDKNSIESVGVTEGNFKEIIRCYFIEEQSITRFYAYFLDNKVVLISLDYLEGEWGLTLGDMIAKYGEPENILTVNYGGEIFVNLISPTNGIAFGYNTIDKPNWYREKISEKIKNGSIYFFDPMHFSDIFDSGELSFGILFGKSAIDNVQKWSGYGYLEDYLP